MIAAHARERGLARAPDESIVAHARERGEVLVSHDLDFSRILAASGCSSPSVIILRLRLPTVQALTSALPVAGSG
jgi:predicted nuclease of predicted toxin-antitoxin system